MMDNYIRFQNDYKVMYEAKDKVTEEAPGPIYASKILQRVEDKMCISYNADTNEYVDLHDFKLIYSDGKNLIGSVSGIPAEGDIRIVIKDTDGKIVLGEGSEEPPVPKYRVTVNPVDNCVTTGSGEYEEGATARVTLAPADGYRFGDGNEPIANEEPMTLDEASGLYWAEFTVAAEDLEISITGVVVEEKPVAHDAYWYVGTEKVFAIDDSWTFEEVPEGATELDHTFGPTSEKSYYGVAVKKSLTPFSVAYMNHVEGQDVLNYFERYDVQFNDEDYYFYMGSLSQTAAAEGDFYQFIW